MYVVFLAAVTKCLATNYLGGKVSFPLLVQRPQSIPAGMSQQQEPEAAGPAALTVRRHRGMDPVLSLLSPFRTVWDLQPVAEPVTFRVCLAISIDLV